MKIENKILYWFRKIAIAEGISFLVLILIAMPLKYGADRPEAVKYVGWAHGVLFMLFLVLALVVAVQLKKNWLWLVKAFVASILPLGTFVLDGHMKKAGDYDSIETKKKSGHTI